MNVKIICNKQVKPSVRNKVREFGVRCQMCPPVTKKGFNSEHNTSIFDGNTEHNVYLVINWTYLINKAS